MCGIIKIKKSVTKPKWPSVFSLSLPHLLLGIPTDKFTFSYFILLNRLMNFQLTDELEFCLNIYTHTRCCIYMWMWMNKKGKTCLINVFVYQNLACMLVNQYNGQDSKNSCSLKFCQFFFSHCSLIRNFNSTGWKMTKFSILMFLILSIGGSIVSSALLTDGVKLVHFEKDENETDLFNFA